MTIEEINEAARKCKLDYKCAPTDILSVSEMRAIIIAANELLQQQQWQPIESAPRDGSEFIIFRYSEASDWCKHLYPKGIPSLDTTKWYDDLLKYDYMWQPLPQPPKDTK